MIKEAIEKIQEMSSQTVISLGDRDFLVNGSEYTEIYPAPIYPDPLTVESLDAMVKMIIFEGLDKNQEINDGLTPLFVKVSDVGKVWCFTGPMDYENRYERPVLYVAHATDVPGWEKEVTMNFEQAMIALRTRFVSTPDTEYALTLLSQITSGAHVTFADNGIATSIVTKKGIDLQANAMIKPIIALKPYRTFAEVDQPESLFLIRISERGISFIEADGGMWRLTARKTIKEYLEQQLKDQIAAGEVVVML